MTLKTVWKVLQKWQRNFNAVQRCILLSVFTIVLGVVVGWWGPAAALHSALPLALFTAHQLTAPRRLSYLTSLVVAAHSYIVTNVRALLRILPLRRTEHVSERTEGEGSVPEVELSRCLEYMYRDFVQSWYTHISDELEFLDEAEQILGETSLLIVDRVQNIDIHGVVPDYVNLIHKHIVDYQEADKHLHIQPNFRHKKDRTKEFKKVKTIVESFNRLGKCHLAVKNGGELELSYLRMLVESIVKVLMPSKLYRCPAAKDLILEILTCQVFLQLVDMFSRPEFLHEVMVLILSDETTVFPDPSPDVGQISALSTEQTPSTSICDTSSPSHIPKETSTLDSGLDDSTKTHMADTALPVHVVRNTDSHTNPAGQENDAIIDQNQDPEPHNHQINHVTDIGHQTGNCSSSNDLRTNSSTPPRASPSQKLSTEALGVGAQDMYVSDALSKYFRISASNMDDVKVVETLRTPQHPNDSTIKESVSAAPLSGSRSLSPSPSPSRSLSESPVLPLPLIGTPPFSDTDNPPTDISFRPTFFIPSDDEMSIHSNSSSVSGDQSLVLEDSMQPNSEPVPHRDTRSVRVDEATKNENSPSNFTRDVTDSSRAPPGSSNAQLILHEQKRHLKHIRNNSADILMSHNLMINSPSSLRKVASSEALTSYRTNSPSPPSLPLARPTSGLVSTATLSKTEPKSMPSWSGPTYQGPPPTPVVPDPTPVSVPPPSSGLAQRGPSPGPGLPPQPTEPLAEGPIEASTPNMPDFLFEEVHIDSTEKVRDPSGSNYVIYLIKYRAWHLEDDTWNLRRGAAHRRYREFVTLQERLEEHPIYKKKIRDIKGPQRWKVLPFGQIEIHGIEARRKFLEGYLQTLVKRDQVGNSLAAREFLAYEGDARLAFVKKATEVPRLDKVIARTFSGVINKLTTTRPSAGAPGEGGSRRGSLYTRGPPAPRRLSLVDGEQLVDQDDLDLDITFSHSDQKEYPVQTMENTLSKHIHDQEVSSAVEFFNVEDSGSDGGGSGDEEGFKDAIEESFTPHIPPQPQGKEIDPAEPVDPLRFTTAVLDLAVQLVKGRNSWVTRDKVIASLKTTVGPLLDSFLHRSIDELTTRERWSHYVRLLTEALWPGGTLGPSESPQGGQSTYTQQHARTCLAEFFPSFLPPVVGEEDFDYAVDLVMEVISHTTLNRHLIYCLLDAIVETAFPEVCTTDIQQQLLTAVVSAGSEGQ